MIAVAFAGANAFHWSVCSSTLIVRRPRMRAIATHAMLDLRSCRSCRMPVHVIGLMLISSCTACSPTPSWTESEKAEALHFIAAHEADGAATDTLNHYGMTGIVPAHAVETALRLKRLALHEARQVSDSVLEKALPGLSTQFRALFQRSLELKIRALEQGDVTAEFEASSLHDRWADWFNLHRTSI